MLGWPPNGITLTQCSMKTVHLLHRLKWMCVCIPPDMGASVCMHTHAPHSKSILISHAYSVFQAIYTCDHLKVIYEVLWVLLCNRIYNQTTLAFLARKVGSQLTGVCVYETEWCVQCQKVKRQTSCDIVFKKGTHMK
jgi:hypothetical protein